MGGDEMRLSEFQPILNDHIFILELSAAALFNRSTPGFLASLAAPASWAGTGPSAP